MTLIGVETRNPGYATSGPYMDKLAMAPIYTTSRGNALAFDGAIRSVYEAVHSGLREDRDDVH